MKNTYFIFLILSMSACSSKVKSRSTFKLFINQAAIEAKVSGGAYLESKEISSSNTILYTLDSANSAIIPYGVYDLNIITFAGPNKNTGTMMCGSLVNINFNSPQANLTVNINESNCMLPKFSQAILSIKKGVIALWDIDKWDLSRWGP